MKIIGCDFHTRYQQIAMLDEATGELVERRLDHESGEAHAFYRDLQGPVRVGIETTGPIRWFERLDGWPGLSLHSLELFTILYYSNTSTSSYGFGFGVAVGVPRP